MLELGETSFPNIAESLAEFESLGWALDTKERAAKKERKRTHSSLTTTVIVTGHALSIDDEVTASLMTSCAGLELIMARRKVY